MTFQVFQVDLYKPCKVGDFNLRLSRFQASHSNEKWPFCLLKVLVKTFNNIGLMKQFLPLLAYHCVCNQSVCQGNVQSGMPCHRSYRPILQHTPVFYFPLESSTNLLMHVRGIYYEVLDSFLGTHRRNARKMETI